MAARVLVVDDSPLILETIAIALEEDGLAVALEADPGKVLQHCKSEKFDLVVCDVCFDQRTACGSMTAGLDAILALRKAYPELPVVVMSGLLREEDLRAMEPYGIAGSLAKPYGPDELIKVVHSALDWSWSEEEVELARAS
ncbi:MAG: response regulator [Oligoflexia bacterium]|nr:response regulator [Oligoflexia bacterium]